MEFILADAVTFSSVWSNFTDAFGTVFTWVMGNAILALLVSVPIGAFLIGTVVRIFK